MQETYYQKILYPFQNKVLLIIQESGVEFYLTGGTALSRFYLQHRYSDDLDLFLNAHPEFKSQCEQMLDAFGKGKLSFEVATTSDAFLRLFVRKNEIQLKMDLVNDVPFHYGTFTSNDKFHRIDHWRNILSNKICALSRMEPKDVADILFIAKNYSFSWENILKEASQKDVWVEPLSVCQLIDNFPINSLNQINWAIKWEVGLLQQDLINIRDDIFYGRSNSLSLQISK